MPIYFGSDPIGDIFSTSESDDYDKVYLGSDQIWPPISFPLVYLNTNVTDAAVPAGATGCWVHLWGGGEAGGNGGHDDSTQSTGSASGGLGGAAAAHIDSIFLYVEDLGPTWSLIAGQRGIGSSGNGTASRFVSGGIDLIANGGVNQVGGTAVVTGLDADYYQPRAYNGGNKEQSSNGGGGGGADGGGASWTGDNAPNTTSPGTRGVGVQQEGQENDPGDGGTGGSAYGSGAGHHYASGGGGGGGGAYTSGGAGGAGSPSSGGSGGVGGQARAEVVWVNTVVPKDKTYQFGAGAWSWTVPSWAQEGWEVDLVMWGGGRGGNNGSTTSAGVGGTGSTPVTRTLVIGDDIALGGTLAGTVGSGGASNGGAGGNTTCTTLGLTAPGATATAASQAGVSAADATIGGKTYKGGKGGTSGTTITAGEAGADPGGGGQGGGSLFFIGQAGGVGGAGRTVIRLRQVMS